MINDDIHSDLHAFPTSPAGSRPRRESRSGRSSGANLFGSGLPDGTVVRNRLEGDLL